jgi:hypothetical protein
MLAGVFGLGVSTEAFVGDSEIVPPAVLMRGDGDCLFAEANR